MALVMIAVADLSGSGGAERLFSHLHEYLESRPELAAATLITASSSLERLRAAGRLVSTDRVIALRLGERPGRGKLAIAWMTLRSLLVILRRRFDVVHICLPSPIYAPLAAALTRLPRMVRPRVSLTVIDCTLAHSLITPPPAGTYERDVLAAHQMYVRWARLDAIYSWYQAFLDVAAERPSLGGASLIRAARYCFTEPERFVPSDVKERLIVFAGRLSEQKRPLLFIDAVAELRARRPDLVRGWQFAIYGKGVLENEVRARIETRGLSDCVMLSHAADMAPVFARSRLLVSTQAFENFTSLSMLEAMAAGNAVIAEDVGQTREFVRPGSNGLLVANANASGFASALVEYLEHPEHHDRMGQASRSLTTDVHTIDHFAHDITAFWRDVAHG